ncbi:rRNA maturation RNase YbeY [Candidatus Pelagibacter sp.]|nr:rRNA maturation RNase YbeY [Candidatus Pelagibacter sp.]
MIKANIILDKKIWISKIKKPEIYFKKKLNKLSQLIAFKNKNQEFTVLLTNNKMMKDLNLKFRNKKKPTDVLSFPLRMKFKKRLYLGDIAISFEIINNRARLSKFDYEFDKMWIHGYLHLLGYDHKEKKDCETMIKQENLIFEKLNNIN